jgi:hypothetical protein
MVGSPTIGHLSTDPGPIVVAAGPAWDPGSSMEINLQYWPISVWNGQSLLLTMVVPREDGWLKYRVYKVSEYDLPDYS